MDKLIKTVLVVDDDRDIVGLITDLLSNKGYEVVVAYDALQAIQFAHREIPDIIILDLVMPAGGGFTTLERLKGSAMTSKIPIIILTGKGSDTDRKRALQLKADDFIMKPFDADMLIRRIKELTR
ncbi:response regulator [candidate division WOR-3 bacterium]|nr:response regulator [candidate division WOR-3 bacterium]